MIMTARGALSAVACALLPLAGCATKAERPTEDLTRATTLIEQAEKAGAQRYAAAELQQAREKVNQAEKAADDGKGDLALRRAREAAADAELANARAASSEAQKAAEELHRSTETLQDEASRKAPDSTVSPSNDTTTR